MDDETTARLAPSTEVHVQAVVAQPVPAEPTYRATLTSLLPAWVYVTHGLPAGSIATSVQVPVSPDVSTAVHLKGLIADHGLQPRMPSATALRPKSRKVSR